MSSLLIGVLGALLATNEPAAVSNLVAQTTGVNVAVPADNDPVEKALKQIMEQDDAAQEEVDGWIRENEQFKSRGAGVSDKDLNRRILKRFEPVRHAYEDLVKQYPTNADARVAYASFLNDLGDHDQQVVQLEKARDLDPKDPAIWNNLANYYGEFGQLTNAFVHYEKAIALSSNEPVYYQNFATTVCMFRKDAKEYYHLNEQGVFDKSLSLYRQALKLDPGNFPLASDLALTFYIIKPLRLEEALQAWTNALNIAHNEFEKEGVYIHLARIKSSAGLFQEARAHLNAVTNSLYADLKEMGLRNIDRREKEALQTNSPAGDLAPLKKAGDAGAN